MKAVVLAGGFAKRLWPLTKDYPKPLLKIKERAIIDYVLEKIKLVKDVDTIYVTTNKRFEPHFKSELKHHFSSGNIKLIVEPADKEENKLGSLGALRALIDKEGIDDDLLVVAGDNLFGFDLRDLVSYYDSLGSTVIAFYNMEDTEMIRNRYGVVVLDKDNKVVEFQEKPEKPKSTLVSTGCYIFPRRILKLLKIYLDNENNADAPGYFVTWLHKSEDIYGFVFEEHWFDIGSHESLREAKEFFEAAKEQK